MRAGSTKEIIESIKRTSNSNKRRYTKQGGGIEGVNSSINKPIRKTNRKRSFDKKIFSNVSSVVSTRVKMGS